MGITKHARKLWLLVAALVLAFGFAQPASAQLADVGPVSDVTGFPLWFEDANGLRVQLCDVFDPNGVLVEQAPCLPDLVDPTAGFVDGNIVEALFYAADGETTAPDGTFIRAQCVLEAAGPEEAGLPNSVANAALIRIRDLVTEGDYSVVTPCGLFEFNHPADTDGGEFGDAIVVEGLLTDVQPFSGALGPNAPVQIFASNGTGDPGFLGNGGGPLEGAVGPLSSPLQVGSDVTTVTVTLDGAPFATIEEFAVVGLLSGCTEANEAPIANTDLETTKAGTAIDINVLANDSDIVVEVDLVEGVVVEIPVEVTPAVGTVTIVADSITPAGAGTAVVNPDNTVTFSPAVGFAGTATFQYTVTDACGAVSLLPASVIILVEDLLANEAEYRVKTGKWNLSGTSNFRDIIVIDGLETAYATGLFGAQEVPPVTSAASGDFAAIFDSTVPDSFNFDLSINVPVGVEITQAHIHVGDVGVNGPIIFFLCTNLGNAPEGTIVEGCTNVDGLISVSGTLTAAELQAAGGITVFNEAIAAIQSGGTYVNAHSVANPGGEIRGQIGRNVISLRMGESGPALGSAEVQAGEGPNLPWSFSGKSTGSLGAAPHLVHAESGLAISGTIELRLR